MYINENLSDWQTAFLGLIHFTYKLNMQLQAVDKITQNSLNKTNLKNILFQKAILFISM